VRGYDTTQQVLSRVTGGYSIRNIRDVDDGNINIVVFYRGIQYDQDIVCLDTDKYPSVVRQTEEDKNNGKQKNIGLAAVKTLFESSGSDSAEPLKIILVGPDLTHHSRKYVKRKGLRLEIFNYDEACLPCGVNHIFQPYTLRKLSSRQVKEGDLPITASLQQYDHRGTLIRFMGFEPGDLIWLDYRHTTTGCNTEYGNVV
jgi:hypothetical protein